MPCKMRFYAKCWRAQLQLPGHRKNVPFHNICIKNYSKLLWYAQCTYTHLMSSILGDSVKAGFRHTGTNWTTWHKPHSQNNKIKAKSGLHDGSSWCNKVKVCGLTFSFCAAALLLVNRHSTSSKLIGYLLTRGKVSQDALNWYTALYSKHVCPLAMSKKAGWSGSHKSIYSTY